MPKIFSGRFAVKILCRDFGFSFVSQKGSHVKLQRKLAKRIITTIIPLHKELAKSTILGILNLAEIDVEEFFRKANSRAHRFR